MYIWRQDGALSTAKLHRSVAISTFCCQIDPCCLHAVVTAIFTEPAKFGRLAFEVIVCSAPMKNAYSIQ